MTRLLRGDTVGRRIARSIAVFLGAAAALLLTTAQFAPGWRAAGQAPALGVEGGGRAATEATGSDGSDARAAPFRRFASASASSPRASSPRAVSQQSVDIASTASPGVRTVTRAWAVLPRRATTGTPVPGVVLVQGAGRGDRDSLLAQARALAASGVAAITYDKHMAGYSVLSRDFTRLADDAIAAASALAAQAGVDSRRIGIMGWSEGGWIAPLAVQRDPARFAFLALASAPIVSPLDQAAWTVDNAMSRAPNWLRRVPAAVLAAGPRAVDYLRFDLGPALESVRVPVYAVWGAEDSTVPVAVAANDLLACVAPPVTIRVLGGAAHALPVSSGDWLQSAAAWMAAAHVGDVDSVSGARPAATTGLAILPANTWFTSPWLHASVAGAIAIAAFIAPIRARRLQGAL